MPDIPAEVTNLPVEGELPERVAEFPQEFDAPEGRPYLISFAKYNHKMCEVDNLAGNKGKKAITLLKEIGTKVFTKADFARNNIKNDLVKFAGEYKKLFSGLAEDIELRELFLQDSGRIFYFDIEPERTMFVVAIRENHLETDKVRR